MAGDITALVDQFVQKVNARRHVPLPPKDVPAFLRRPFAGEDAEIYTGENDWQILATDHATRIVQLETRISRPFPRAFRELITRYSFPAFDCGSLTFFANTGHELSHELSV